MSKEKWYNEGLRFQCTECGKCCSGSPGFVWVSEEEVEQMAQFLEISVEQFNALYTRVVDGYRALIEDKARDYACVFLDNNRCRVYGARPVQCRTFPWWDHNLSNKQSWKKAARHCEGISEDAPLVRKEVIKENFEEHQANLRKLRLIL